MSEAGRVAVAEPRVLRLTPAGFPDSLPSAYGIPLGPACMAWDLARELSGDELFSLLRAGRVLEAALAELGRSDVPPEFAAAILDTLRPGIEVIGKALEMQVAGHLRGGEAA